MPSVAEQPDHPALLLRTGDHKPLSLRRLLVQSTFRNADSYLTFPIGQTLDQQLIVRDLGLIEHLLIIGEGNARKHLLTSSLVTLTLFNTPAELRLAIAGESAFDYSQLTTTPHALGKHLKDPQHVRKLIDGLTSESQRRLNAFYEQGVNQLDAYNAQQKQNGKLPLPRIVIALDSLTGLESIHGAIVPQLRDLIINGAQAGLHVIYTVDSPDLVPSELAGLTRTEIILRSVAPDYMDRLKGFHPSLLRFVDAFVIDRGQDAIIPVELCAVADHEIRRTVDYWTATADQRKREDATSATSGRTGVTGFLRSTEVAAASAPAPNRMPEAQPRGTTPLPQSVNLTQQQATSLAAYLGWVSASALRDILLLTEAEAREMIDVLRLAGVVEQTDGLIYRFVRLADPPPAQ
jgi:DNA segregation ATPase FtsK/SpoIIIE-like protein